MIVFRKRLLRIGQLWFDQEPGTRQVDLLYFHQRAAPVPATGNEEFCTLVVDLTRSHEETFAAIKKDSRNEIRRSESKDLVACTVIEPRTMEDAAEFLVAYDRFANRCGIQGLNREYIAALIRESMLVLTRAANSAGELLVYHGYLIARKRARLLYSASESKEEQRAVIGRANKFLHWHDMNVLRGRGNETYDFGGWYAGTSDQKRLAINKFKEEFGGVPIKEFNCCVPSSTLGQLAVRARAIWPRCFTKWS